jgi:hypothetical protein
MNSTIILSNANTNTAYGVDLTLFGLTQWNQNTSLPNTVWTSISLSASGQYQSATDNSYVYTTFNYGNTWNVSTTNYGCKSVAVSASGELQTFGTNNNGIWTSSDYGQTWIQRKSGAGIWMGIDLSASGKYQTALDSNTGNIWISSNYGNTWSTSAINYGANLRQVSISESGQYQSVIENVSPRAIYTSSDYGVNWTIHTGGGLASQWGGISVSGSGQYQTAVANDGNGIYVSIDYGITWNFVGYDNKQWGSVSMSSSGQYQVAGDDTYHQSMGIYYSINYGQTWQLCPLHPPSPGYRYGASVISVSSSGQYITSNNAYNDDNIGYIYTTFIPNTFNDLITNPINLYCANVYASTAVYANNVELTSDYRIKENVKTMDNKFQVDYLRPVTYTNRQTQKQDIGLIAHELQEYYPELVSGVKDGPETQTVNYIGLIPILIKEIKELKKAVKALGYDM